MESSLHSQVLPDDRIQYLKGLRHAHRIYRISNHDVHFFLFQLPFLQAVRHRFCQDVQMGLIHISYSYNMSQGICQRHLLKIRMSSA